MALFKFENILILLNAQGRLATGDMPHLQNVEIWSMIMLSLIWWVVYSSHRGWGSFTAITEACFCSKEGSRLCHIYNLGWIGQGHNVWLYPKTIYTEKKHVYAMYPLCFSLK